MQTVALSLLIDARSIFRFRSLLARCMRRTVSATTTPEFTPIVSYGELQ